MTASSSSSSSISSTTALSDEGAPSTTSSTLPSTPVPTTSAKAGGGRRSRALSVSDGAIAGIAIGALAGIALVVAVFILIVRLRRQTHGLHTDQGRTSAFSAPPSYHPSSYSMRGDTLWPYYAAMPSGYSQHHHHPLQQTDHASVVEGAYELGGQEAQELSPDNFTTSSIQGSGADGQHGTLK
ncbi:hypothetical protein ANO11243_085500 [Dothideomycetidae sp. 11243]|nr:hypothetical protein ANO11243_085500 [fungal sp. No.11243]